MKKFVSLVAVMLVFTLSGFAATATKQRVALAYDSQKNLVKAVVSVTEGDAIVGHFGLSYNTEKLRVVDLSGAPLPSPLPEKAADGTSILTKIVQAGGKNIVITPETAKASELVDSTKGYLLFGWYATKDIPAITPDTDEGKIAELYFELAADISYDDLTADDILPVPTALTKDISGWSNGIIVITSQNTVYCASGAGGTELLVTEVVYQGREDSDASKDDNAASTDQTDDTQDDDNTPDGSSSKEEPGKTDAAGRPIVKEDENAEPQTVVGEFSPNGSTEQVDFLLRANAYEDKIRFLWQTPSGRTVHSYRLIIKDTDGNTVRDLRGIVGVSRSMTVDKLAPGISFTAQLDAYAADGTHLAQKDVLSVGTKAASSGSVPVIFTVSYDAGEGDLYGLESEEVLFGDRPTKTPEVYAPTGFRFDGWSIDGKTTVELEDMRIYEDVTFIALFEEKA